MGNTVSAAEAVAAGITHATQQQQQQSGLAQDHSKFDMKSAPPPECPMHQKLAPPPASECPVINTNKDDINPYNRVSSNLIGNSMDGFCLTETYLF